MHDGDLLRKDPSATDKCFSLWKPVGIPHKIHSTTRIPTTSRLSGDMGYVAPNAEERSVSTLLVLEYVQIRDLASVLQT